jgi:glutathione S-transferase
VGDDVIFESAVITEFLEDTVPPALHPAEPVRRADHRAWIEFAGVVLSDIWGFYNAPDAQAFEKKRQDLVQRFQRLEDRLVADPWFDGAAFHLVDAAFGPVFRYFDVFDVIEDFGILKGKPKIARWRKALKERPSVKSAVVRDYHERLKDFIVRRNSYMSGLILEAVCAGDRAPLNSPPPRGEGLGWGSFRTINSSIVVLVIPISTISSYRSEPTPTLRVDPPRKGEGKFWMFL